MVASSRFGLLRKATGHSVTRSFLTWIYCPGSVDELALQDKGNRLLRALCICGDLCGLLVAGKWLVVVASISLVRRSALRMAPYPVFENFIPNVPSSGLGFCGISAHEVWIKYSGV